MISSDSCDSGGKVLSTVPQMRPRLSPKARGSLGARCGLHGRALPAPSVCRELWALSGYAHPAVSFPMASADGPSFPGRDGKRARAQLPSLTGSRSVLRELQEREKALRLQREKLQRELEEKKKKVQGSWACGAHVGSELSFGPGWGPDLVAPGAGAFLPAWPHGAGVGEGEHIHMVSNVLLATGPRKSSSAWLSSSGCRRSRRKPRRPQRPAKA